MATERTREQKNEQRQDAAMDEDAREWRARRRNARRRVRKSLIQGVGQFSKTLFRGAGGSRLLHSQSRVLPM
jgi:hypothetical protein